jgi:hypothetical protein
MTQPETLSPSAVAAELLAAEPATVPAAPAEPLALPAPAAKAPLPAPEPNAPTDRNGNPFRRGFHRENADGTPFRNKHGFFMPRGGRKPAAAPVSLPATASEPPAPTPTPSAPESAAESPWTAAERASAAAPASDPTAPAADQPKPATDAADHCADAAEAVTHALYLVVGAVTGAPDEANPAASEHANLCRSVAAYVRSTGWRGGPLAGAVLAVSAYLLRTLRKPKSAEQVEAWMRSLRKPAPKNVTPMPQPAPAPAAAGPVRHTAATAPLAFGGFTERAG